jgi:hypothetical protein
MSSAEVILLGILDTKKKIVTSKHVTKISMAPLNILPPARILHKVTPLYCTLIDCINEQVNDNDQYKPRNICSY